MTAQYQLIIKAINKYEIGKEDCDNIYYSGDLIISKNKINNNQIKIINKKELKRFLQDYSNSLQCHTLFLKLKGYLTFNFSTFTDLIYQCETEYLIEYSVTIKKNKKGR